MNAATGFRRRSARAFTLLEIAVSVMIISAVILTTVQMMHISAEHMGFQQIIVDQQAHTRAALDNMVGELRCMRGALKDFDTGVASGTWNTAHTALLSLNNTLPIDSVSLSPVGAELQYPSGAGSGYEKDAVMFNIPTYDPTTNTVNYGSTATAITYRWMSTGAGMGRIERVVGATNNITNVVLDNVPQNGFEVVKNGRRLAIRIGQSNSTPIQTNNGNQITTFVTQITYCLRNY